MSSRTLFLILAAGVLLLLFASPAEAEVDLDRLYGRKVPPIPPGMKWNPRTGQLVPMLRITVGKDRF